MKKINYLLGVAGMSAVLMLGLALPRVVGAEEHENEDKVTICHRSDSAQNPYQKIEVDKSAVDGEGENDHTQHTGPVATSEEFAQELKDQKINWGDIIPPFDEFEGLNWTDQGIAIYNNDCKYVVEEPVVPPVVQGTQVTAKPTGAVNAGVGGAVSSGLATVLAVVGMGSLGLGLRRFNN